MYCGRNSSSINSNQTANHPMASFMLFLISAIFHGFIAAESGSGVGVTKTSKWLS